MWMKKLTKQNSSAITQLETAEALQVGMPLFYAAIINFCFLQLEEYTIIDTLLPLACYHRQVK